MSGKEERQRKKEKKKREKLEDRARIAEEKRLDREQRWKIENPYSFMRIIDIVCIVLFVVALFLGIRYLINLNFVHRFNQGSYSAASEEFLAKLNIPEGYVPHYNAGNAYYMLEQYDEAISAYKAALESHPPEKKECDIRVNLALAMLHKIDFDNLETEKQKASAIRQLQSARKVLVEKGCADPYGTDGHDPEAEQLKQDIDKLLEELGAEPEPPDSDDGDEGDESDQGGEDTEQQKSYREQQLQKDLEDQREDAMEERREADNERQYKEDSSGQSGSSGGNGGNNYDDPYSKNW